MSTVIVQSVGRFDAIAGVLSDRLGRVTTRQVPHAALIDKG
jgi:hypothetical protein